MPSPQQAVGQRVEVAPTAPELRAQRAEEETTERFARQFQLATVRDTCGDLIIPAQKGHLYFDRDELCWALVEGGPWNLRPPRNLLRGKCKEVICAEGEAIFKGITPPVWKQVVAQCGASEIVRKEVCKSLRLQ